MKCPNDQTEMEKGELTTLYGGVRWTKGGILKIGKAVTTYKCPRCGKIELYIKGK